MLQTAIKNGKFGIGISVYFFAIQPPVPNRAKCNVKQRVK